MHTANIEIRECVKLSLTRSFKNNGKSLTVRPKKRSRSLTGDGRLLEVPTVRLRLVKIGVLDWWSLIRGGSLRDVAAHVASPADILRCASRVPFPRTSADLSG